MDVNVLSNKVIGAAIEVRKALGPGLLESAYEECLCHELCTQNIVCKRQMPIPLEYKGVKLNCGYRLDVLVDDKLIVEIKSCNSIEPIHKEQLIPYLKLTHLNLGLIINFNVSILKDGIKRIVYKLK